MELIDRYVGEVGARLRRVRRQQVEAELRAAILDALDSRGGDAASEEDVIAVLAELGDPEAMAAGYEPGRQYLIGPDLYPHFRRGLRTALRAIVVVGAVAFCVSLLMGGLAGYRAGGLLVQTLGYAAMAAVAVLIVQVTVFAWLQRADAVLPSPIQMERSWDPRSLPATPESAAGGRFDAVAGLVSATVALVIVGLIGQVAREAEPHASAQLQPLIRDGVSRNVMMLQIALSLAALAHAVALVGARWGAWTQGMRLAADAIALFVFVPLPFRLLGARSALLEAGMAGNVVTWLIANAFIFAAILVGLMAYHWWRAPGTRPRSPDQSPCHLSM